MSTNKETKIIPDISSAASVVIILNLFFAAITMFLISTNSFPNISANETLVWVIIIDIIVWVVFSKILHEPNDVKHATSEGDGK